MEMFFDGRKIDPVATTISIVSDEKDTSFVSKSFGMKEVNLTLKNAEFYIYRMSDKTRLWCKELRWGGNTYL